uniref:CHK domain-containing protein n=1 Tax=Heterorhabditis bacteriophora TaxID=37862 RepID=A0A1I7XAG4_HETBA
MSDRSTDHDGHENKEYLCGTDVTLQWLLQMMADTLNKPFEEEPQWITERLNRPSWDEYATSSVIRVTFGWEDDDLPKSVVLKTPVSKEMREDDEGKFHYIMFKRECNVYEWTQKYPKLAAPRIFHIKRNSKEGSGVVVMEDIGDRGQQQDAAKGLSLDAMRDLLRNLALLHAQSMKQTSWSTLYTAKFFTTEYLHETATESAEALKVPRVLVHGEPYASNVFVILDAKEQRLAGLIDWTECHSGCFAEDLAKAICWNLSAKDRMEFTSSLLEGYHYHLTRYSDGECHMTIDLIRRGFEQFLPMAMVTLVAKVMQVRTRNDVEPLIERAKSLIQNVYAMTRLMQDV